jgi:hypothetical protein
MCIFYRSKPLLSSYLFKKELLILVIYFFLFDGTFGLVLKPVLWICKTYDFIHRAIKARMRRPMSLIHSMAIGLHTQFHGVEVREEGRMI